MNSGPSGFYNAPVTKVICVGCGVLSLLAGTRGAQNKFSLSYQAIFQERELWRLLTSNFFFSSAPEILFGLYLLYFFRVFERQLGSNKFAAFTLISTITATALEVTYVHILKDTQGLSPGPFALIFASFVPFFFDIPISTRFTVAGLKFSDKSFVYLGGLQLLLSSWKRSLIPGLCGVLAGFAYRSNILGVRRLKFPDAVVAVASQLFSPIISRSPPSVAGRGSAHQGGNNVQPGRMGARPPPPPPAAMMNPEPDRELFFMLKEEEEHGYKKTDSQHPHPHWRQSHHRPKPRFRRWKPWALTEASHCAPCRKRATTWNWPPTFSSNRRSIEQSAGSVAHID